MPNIPTLPPADFGDLPDLNSPEEQIKDALNIIAAALTCVAHDVRAIREMTVADIEPTPES